ncbi:unnamed protein product [Sphenostylis stenocarpa]|uniref:Uncharacterized protein n=1 Tax=Sphenostylis stenocarpa TaxID=92480 RepID=A0AA86T0A9_9FABA|nr:unnamed protein product [Sphenostylis stenocarpa]
MYGYAGSWEKLFTLTQDHFHIGSPKLKSLRPLLLDGDRVLLEQNHSKLCWYNGKSGDVSFVRIPGVGNSIERTVCVGSLVPPALLSFRDESEKRRLGHQKWRKNIVWWL